MEEQFDDMNNSLPIHNKTPKKFDDSEEKL